METTWPLRQGWWGAIALIGCMLFAMNNIWPLRQGWLLPIKLKTNENGHFATPSGFQMIFSVDLDIKFLMKKSAPPSGMLLPWRRGEIPDGGVALTQREELKFLAGINHNTPFVFLHDINIMYDINSLQGIAPGHTGTPKFSEIEH